MPTEQTSESGSDSSGRHRIRAMSQELWQPISVIIGYAELLATRPRPEPERAAMLQEIRRASGRLGVYLDRLERGEGEEASTAGDGGWSFRPRAEPWEWRHPKEVKG